MKNIYYWAPCLANVGTVKSTINSETIKVLRSPKRPFFNFASQYVSRNQFDFTNFNLNANVKILNSTAMNINSSSIHPKSEDAKE